MALEGKRKAALLLLSLEPATAAELLKSARPELITEIAAELSRLESAGQGPDVDDEPVREFSMLLTDSHNRGGSEFVKQVLQEAVGATKSLEVLGRVEHLAKLRDPFVQVRKAPVEQLAVALTGESAQVAAMVLGELVPKKSATLLGMLDEEIRGDVLRGMTSSEPVSPEARLCVATVVEERLAAQAESADSGVAAPMTDKGREDKLRKVALLLRGLDVAVRGPLLEDITGEDPDAGEEVQRLMVVWEDLAVVSEKNLQEMVRAVDSRKLAMALVGTDQALTQRIRENMSERAASMLDEEASLLSKPKQQEIEEAQDEVLKSLRDMNAAGELEIEED